MLAFFASDCPLWVEASRWADPPFKESYQCPKDDDDGLWHRVDSSIDVNVSEKHTVSIFRGEVAILGSGGICTDLGENLQSHIVDLYGK
jgi:hypothetical protein